MKVANNFRPYMYKEDQEDLKSVELYFILTLKQILWLL